MRRREFIAGLGGVVTWPLATRAQQPAMPVIGFVSGGTADAFAKYMTAFREGLVEAGHAEGRDVTIEYHFDQDRPDGISSLMIGLVRRRVAVIVAISPNVAIAAKAATGTIPIVFAADQDPVKLGLVFSLGRPGGNATGISFYLQEVAAKRLELLHRLVPNSVRIAALVNPAVPTAVATVVQELQDAARVIGLHINVLNASTSREIDAAFASLAHERSDALFVAADTFFASRAVQLANLAARERIPAAFGNAGYVVVGGLMSYGTDIAESMRQVGIYSGDILSGAKPADLPVVQPSKFELAINMQTARLLGVEVPPSVLAIADKVIE